jgi:signal peptidase
MDSGDGDEEWPGRWDDRESDSGANEATGNGGWSADGLVEGESGDGDGHEGSGESGPLARVRWFMNTDEEWVAFVREVLSSLAVVAIVGLVLFAVSGLWPPMVAIESPSMEPNMVRGDLVFLMEEHRFAGGAAYNGTGVVPFQAGAAAGYSTFNKYGDVIVYQPDGNGGKTPIIHRARFWVNDSENWYDEANEEYLGGADSCEELANCPAEHGGFITKGDNNGQYDQVGAEPISEPVKPSWITGTAEFKIPWLGEIRLLFGMVEPAATVSSVVPHAGLAGIGVVNSQIAG